VREVRTDPAHPIGLKSTRTFSQRKGVFFLTLPFLELIRGWAYNLRKRGINYS